MKSIPVRNITAHRHAQSPAGRFHIREVQTILGGQDLAHPLHRHDFFFILALQKGRGKHEIDFVQYEIHDHVIFIIRPGQVHQLLLKAGCTGYLAEFDAAFYQPENPLTDQRWKKAVNKNYCEADVNRFMKLLTVLRNIFDEYTSKEEGYTEAIKAHLDLFFLEYTRQSSYSDNKTGLTNNYTQDRFEEFLALLETNIGSLKTVSQYAALMHLSHYQLNSITKASVGKTVSDLVNEQIILEAKRYLLATPHQVKDVAGHLGYEDVSYFIRFFKKHTGHSPEAFRKNFK